MLTPVSNVVNANIQKDDYLFSYLMSTPAVIYLFGVYTGYVLLLYL